MADYRKLDAGLAAALDRAAPASMSVFIHMDGEADKKRRAHLARLGVRTGSIQGGIATATLTAEQVSELSEQPWVQRIRSSTPLRLLESD